MSSIECLPCLSATWPLGLLSRTALAAHALLLFGGCFLVLYPGLDPLSRAAGYASLAGTALAHVFWYTYFPDARAAERFARAEEGAHPLTDFPDTTFPIKPEAWMALVLAYNAAFAALFAWASGDERHDAARAYTLACVAWHAFAAALAAWTMAMLIAGNNTPATSYARQRFRAAQRV